MSTNLRNVEMLVEGQNPMAQVREYTERLVDRWGQLGLLEGLNTQYERNATAILLENQARQVLSEASSTGTTAGSEEWAGVALPLVRRIFAEIAAKDFVSIQPMNLPAGLVFYLDFKYGTNQAGFTVDSSLSQVGTVHGVTSTIGADASGGLYGPGRFGYSINDYTSSITITSAMTGSAVTWADVQFNGNLSASLAGLVKLTFDVTSTTPTMAQIDTTGVRAFAISGSGILTYYPGFTSLSGNNLSFICSGSSVAMTSSANTKVWWHKQPYMGAVPDDSHSGTQAMGDFEDKGAGLDIPELDLQMRSQSITAKTRKLKAVWTPEFAQDLNAYHSIDAEAEVTSILSEYISMEIDLEILDMLILNAATTDYWSARVGYEWDTATLSFFPDTNVVAASAYNKMTWYQTLGIKLQRVSNKIHQKTMRGGANFLVCSPDVATILESIPGYAADTDGNKQQFAMGVQKVGLLNNRFNVYKNPYMTDNTLLMGYRGNAFLETGAVYAPYIPLIMTPLVYDPNTFTPRKAIMTRYAKKMVRPEFYGKIYVGHLNFV